jgi:hypothetical protein
MKLNGQDHFCRTSVKRCSFHGAEELPLTRSPLRRSRAPSIERCPTSHARARHAGPATVLPALPPRSRLPAPRSPTPRSHRGRLDPPRDPGLITLGRAGQTPPVDFCNHHGSQARPRNLTHSPCRPCKGYTPRTARWQAALPLWCKRRPGCLGSRGQHGLYEHASTSLCDHSPESFAPDRSARTPRVTEACPRPAGSAGRGGKGRCPHDSAHGQRARRRPRKGSRSAPFRDEGPGTRTRGAFCTNGRPGGRHGYPQVVTSLWSGRTTPFVPPHALSGVDVPSEPRRVDCP